jgi:hypothetical protein
MFSTQSINLLLGFPFGNVFWSRCATITKDYFGKRRVHSDRHLMAVAVKSRLTLARARSLSRGEEGFLPSIFPGDWKLGMVAALVFAVKRSRQGGTYTPALGGGKKVPAVCF